MKAMIVGLIIFGGIVTACTQLSTPQGSGLTDSWVEGSLVVPTEILIGSSDCRAPIGEGTVEPAVSIVRMVFEINGEPMGLEAGEGLPARAGDEVRLLSITLCVGEYSSNPGEVCADLVPVMADGVELRSQHAGTHMAAINQPSVTLEGPEMTWTISDDWMGFRMVVNHWAGQRTQDSTCADAKCEHDDWLEVPFE